MLLERKPEARPLSWNLFLTSWGVSVAVALLAACCTSSRAQDPQRDAPANPQKLVPPSAYRNIPDGIRAKLQGHGCSLPETQATDNGAEPINVVSGHFTGEKQLDWAAICVIRDRPEIFVIWSSQPPACPSEIHSGWPLKQKFSQEPEGGLFLRKAASQKILSYRRAFPEGKKPPVNHDGLEVGNEQASLIFYCHSGKWLELRGND